MDELGRSMSTQGRQLKRSRTVAPSSNPTSIRSTSNTAVKVPTVRISAGFLSEASKENPEFVDGIAGQAINIGSQGPNYDEAGTQFVLSVVKGIDPRDAIETMLAMQMAAVHKATMTFARRLAHVDNIAQQDAAERAFNKLSRTFAMQMDALKRYRSDGRQTVRIERVDVHDGGQAIVGNVGKGGGGQ